MAACHDRRVLDRPDRIVSREPTAYGDVLCGSQRYCLKMQGSDRWVSLDDIFSFTADPDAALLFPTRGEAFSFVRSLVDEDGFRPLVGTVQIEAVS